MCELALDPSQEENVKCAFASVLKTFGFDLTDPNFKDTPKRMLQVYSELLYGHTSEALKELENHLTKTFPSFLDEMILIRNIESVGICPHHMLPVNYITHIAYIPNQKVIGYSKIPRLVKILSSKAMLQEDLIDEIAKTLMDAISPKGVGVHMTGIHSCAKIRGVKSHNADMVISCLKGCLKNTDSRMEFLTMISGK